MTITYRFVALHNSRTAVTSYNALYVEAFVGAMNARDYVRHATERDEHGQFLEPRTQGWSYGLAPRFFDGRVTTKRTSWVYGIVTEDMPEGACALVYFTTDGAPIGYLVRE